MSKGTSFFIQDSFPLGRLTINAGVRTERWEHFATTGANIVTFDWEFAPRLSAVFDVPATAGRRPRRTGAATTIPCAPT